MKTNIMRTSRELEQLKKASLSDYGGLLISIANYQDNLGLQKSLVSDGKVYCSMSYKSNKSGYFYDKWELFENGNRTVTDIINNNKIQVIYEYTLALRR